MPKTLDQIVQETLGGHQWTIIRLLAENEQLRAQLAEKDAADQKAKEIPMPKLNLPR